MDEWRKRKLEREKGGKGGEWQEDLGAEVVGVYWGMAVISTAVAEVVIRSLREVEVPSSCAKREDSFPHMKCDSFPVKIWATRGPNLDPCQGKNIPFGDIFHPRPISPRPLPYIFSRNVKPLMLIACIPHCVAVLASKWACGTR